jgi:riboflavin kinase/FMN adenylyltransferase
VEIYRDPLGSDEPPRGSVLSIGNFDGVHIGHQAVLRHVVARGAELGTTGAALTLEPHPVKLLRPREAPRLVTTLPQRLQLIERTGIGATLVVPFTRQLARSSAEDFVREVLVRRLAIREVYIGANFRFGADRGGDVELLRGMGRELGFVAESAPTVEHGGAVVSSTRVRQTLADGRVGEAAGLLGRYSFVDGEVLEGKRLGRRLGFPTLNIGWENELVPSKGVYVTAVHIPSFMRTFPSVTNIGVRPTLYENSHVTMECHLLNFTADVYRERVRLFFLERLRDELHFASTTKLMVQIKDDVAAARAFCAAHPMNALDLVLP